jgi:hypothetical protein
MFMDALPLLSSANVGLVKVYTGTSILMIVLWLPNTMR